VGSAAETAAEPPKPAAEFDSEAARVALGAGAAAASGCRKAEDPSGTAQLTITFAPSGRVTSARIAGPPFQGTPTGSCIAGAFHSVRVPAFGGAAVTITKEVTIR
jgi:hypothetical protein